MNKQTEPPTSDERSLRSAWIVLTIIFALLLILQLVRWIQGGSKVDSILVPVALLLMGLAHVLQLRGMAQRVVLIVSGVVAVLALVIPLIREFKSALCPACCERYSLR